VVLDIGRVDISNSVPYILIGRVCRDFEHLSCIG